MTPRTLFIIILKVLGVLAAKELFSAVPQLIYTVYSMFIDFGRGSGLFLTFISLIAIAVNVWLVYTLIFKAVWVVDTLHLDKGFKEPALQVQVSMQTILRIAIIVTGALLIIVDIPRFCKLVYFIVQEKQSVIYPAETDWGPVILSGVSIIIGFLIIGERNRILDLLMSKQEKTEAEIAESEKSPSDSNSQSVI